MGKAMTKEKKIKNLEKQIHKFSSNPEIVEKLKVKLRTYKKPEETKKK
jgi:hypothetical protein